MHWLKSSNMTKTCYHHMLFVRGVGFYSKITFLTPISRSKVICRSKSCDMLGQGQWSFPPSLVKIGQVMTELQRDWQKKEERILQRQNKTACLPSCKKLIMQYNTLPRCTGRVREKKCMRSAQNLPFLCWNGQIWSNSNTFKIILWGMKIFWGNAPMTTHNPSSLPALWPHHWLEVSFVELESYWTGDNLHFFFFFLMFSINMRYKSSTQPVFWKDLVLDKTFINIKIFF